MKKNIGSVLLLFALILQPFGGQALQDADVIDIISQMPFEVPYAEATLNFERAFGSQMITLYNTENYAISYLDREDLTLFGYPVAVTTHQNAIWDHCLVFFANSHEKMQYLNGGRGTFLTLLTNKYPDREVYTTDAIQLIDEIYHSFDSPFGKLKAGGIMVYHDDGSGMEERLLSLPLLEDRTIDMNEVERLFRLCSHGTCSVVLETDKSWQMHFEISVSGELVEIVVACLRTPSSFLEELGFKGFEGPDGDSSTIHGN